MFPNSLFRAYVAAIPALNREFGNNLMCHPVVTTGKARLVAIATLTRTFPPQVLEILQSADATNLYSPEVEREKRKQTNAVTTDLLGALLAVSSTLLA